MALIVNYAGSVGLHVILDNHRSEGRDSAEANGLWYVVSGSTNFPESAWIYDWLSVQTWTHAIPQNLGGVDTITVTYLASDGFPTVLGFDLRNEPHTPSQTAYSQGATWGTGEGVDPQANPNPNPFALPCVSASTCHDWRLAAERAGDTLLGTAHPTGYATSEPRGGKSPEKRAKTAEMWLPERKLSLFADFGRSGSKGSHMGQSHPAGRRRCVRESPLKNRPRRHIPCWAPCCSRHEHE